MNTARDEAMYVISILAGLILLFESVRPQHEINKIGMNSALKDILYCNVADEILARSGPSVKAEDERLHRVWVGEVSPNGLEDCVGDKVLTKEVVL